MKKLILMLQFLLLLMTSCDELGKVESKSFWIDNPTGDSITIHIDSNQYEIPAISGLYVGLQPGKHQLQYKNQNIKFVVKPNDKEVVLNPTLSNYIFYHEIYTEVGADAEMSKVAGAYLHDFKLSSGEVVNELFINQYEYYWHLGITQPMPESITIRKDASPLKTAPQSKLFRLNEFYTYIGLEHSNLIATSIMPNDPIYSKLHALKLIDDSTICDCEPANEAINTIRLRFDSLKTVSPEQFKATYDRLRYDRVLDEFEKECSPRYNKSIEKNNFDSIMVTVGQNIQNLGSKNAYIVD